MCLNPQLHDPKYRRAVLEQAPISAMHFGKRGPENSLVPHGSGPRHRSVVATPNGAEAEKLLEMELGFHSERSALRELSDAEFDRARGAEHLGRTTLDCDMFVETVSEAWWMNRRSALAAFTALDSSSRGPGGRIEGRMNRHQYLLLREAFVHGENIDHPVIKKLRLTAIWHRADVDHNGLITHNELINWLRHLCSSDSHVRACLASVARRGSAGPPAPRPKPHAQARPSPPPSSPSPPRAGVPHRCRPLRGVAAACGVETLLRPVRRPRARDALGTRRLAGVARPAG